MTWTGDGNQQSSISSTGQHCCACAGVCYHIPPASFCGRHDRIAPQVYMPIAPANTCDHCYCRTVFDTRGGELANHKQCCNCGNKQAVRT